MAAPWEKYATTPSSQDSGPWAKYTAPKVSEEKGMLRKGLEAAGKTLDYPGGLLRTGIAQVGELASPKDDIVTKEDWINAVKGPFGEGATPSAEYLERAGVDEGPSLDIPILGNVSARDVGGFALDTITDPVMAVSKAAKPIAGLIEGSGKKMYKSGFKKIDERLAETGSKPLSDVLYEKGIWGTTKSMKNKMNELSKELGVSRQKLYDEAEKLGARVDVEKASEEALKQSQKLRSQRGAEDLGADLEKSVRSLYEPLGNKTQFNPLTTTLEKVKYAPISLEEASGLKTRLRNSLPKSAWEEGGYLKADAGRINKTQSAGLQNAIIEEANRVKPGMGEDISRINEDWGSLIEAHNPTKMQVRRETTPNALTSVDAMLGAITKDPGILAAKKAADLTKTAAFRTGGGLALKTASKVPHLDDATRRALINILRSEENQQ